MIAVFASFIVGIVVGILGTFLFIVLTNDVVKEE